MIEISEMAVFAATIVTMIIGAAWYSQSLFGKRWMAIVKLDRSHMEGEKPQMWKYILAAFVSNFIVLYILAHFLEIARQYDAENYLVSAFWMALLVMMTHTGSVIWEGRPLTYFWIVAGYVAVTIIVGAYVIVYWPW